MDPSPQPNTTPLERRAGAWLLFVLPSALLARRLPLDRRLSRRALLRGSRTPEDLLLPVPDPGGSRWLGRTRADRLLPHRPSRRRRERSPRRGELGRPEADTAGGNHHDRARRRVACRVPQPPALDGRVRGGLSGQAVRRRRGQHQPSAGPAASTDSALLLRDLLHRLAAFPGR